MSYLEDIGNCKGKFNPQDIRCTAEECEERDDCIMQSILWVPINRIDCEADPYREEDDESLKESLARTRGPLQPIVATFNQESQKFEVLFGVRRFKALKDMGWEEIPLGYRDIEGIDKTILRLHENIHRKDYSPLGLCKALTNLKEKHNMSQKDIAKALGKSEGWVSSVLKAEKLPESIKKKIENGEVKPGVDRVAKLARIPEKKAEKLIERGATKQEVAKASRSPGRKLKYQWVYKGKVDGISFSIKMVFNDEDIEPKQILDALEECKKGV